MAVDQDTEKHEPTKLGKIGARPFWVLKLSIGLRALHQIGAAVFLTAYLLDDIPCPPPLFFLIVTISGVALLLAEGMRHRQIYRELSGLSTLLKLVLIGGAYHGYLPATATVLAAFTLASISSHAPKQYRHRLLY